MKQLIKNTINSQKVFYRYARRKGWRRFLKENILESEGSDIIKAQSIALGIFIGFSPFWGFHTFLAISLPIYLRMNKMLTFLFSQITIAPLIPILIYVSLLIGTPLTGGTTDFKNQEINFETIKNHLLPYAIGSMILASTMATLSGTTAYFLMKFFKSKS